MNSGWVRVTKTNPCPICERPKYCSVSADGAVACCMWESSGAFKHTDHGGHIHRLCNSPAQRFLRSRRKIHSRTKPIREDLPDFVAKCRSALRKNFTRFKFLSNDLGVPPWTLERLQVGWSEYHRAFSFPMKNAAGRVIGIRFRAILGKKFALTGSHNGLFISDKMLFGLDDRLLICEGPTDCAAILSLGFNVVGRASCSEGAALLRNFCRTQKITEVVVVADSDEPGQRGANALANELCLYVPVVRVIQPPEGIKDARAWVNAGVTAEDVEQTMSNTTPKKLQIGR